MALFDFTIELTFFFSSFPSIYKSLYERKSSRASKDFLPESALDVNIRVVIYRILISGIRYHVAVPSENP